MLLFWWIFFVNFGQICQDRQDGLIFIILKMEIWLFVLR